MLNTSETLTADDLLAFPIFEGETREAAEWIAAQMWVQIFEGGEDFANEGAAVQHFFLILSGELHFRTARMDATLIVSPGTAIGILPFSRMKTWGAQGQAVSLTRVATMEAAKMRELVYRAPVFAQHLVSEMMDRAREFTRMEEGTHRLMALGKLSAGLAHELNNPAAAVVRSSARLREILGQKRQYMLTLHSEVIPEEARKIFSRLADSLVGCVNASAGGSLERMDRESELADWLQLHDGPAECAALLTDAGIGLNDLKPLVSLSSPNLFSLAVSALAAEYEVLCLASEVEEASRRVSELVQAVKVYSYMDRNPVSDVDVELGIDSTLRMFQHRTKMGIEVVRRFSGNVPKIRANGGALNQVWTNLIDNALDALETLPPGTPRHIGVHTILEPSAVLVEVEDSGPGIPLDVQRRMFEPFFTTKPVGDGTGLGLDIVQRIIREHKGTIRVESEPGKTTIQVRLPLGESSMEISL